MKFRPEYVLAGVQAADAVACAAAAPPIVEALDRVQCPPAIRPVLPVVKAVSSAGLVAGAKFPRVGQITAWSLVVYFIGALGFHVKSRDLAVQSFGPAVAMLGLSAGMARNFDKRIVSDQSQS